MGGGVLRKKEKYLRSQYWDSFRDGKIHNKLKKYYFYFCFIAGNVLDEKEKLKILKIIYQMKIFYLIQVLVIQDGLHMVFQMKLMLIHIDMVMLH